MTTKCACQNHQLGELKSNPISSTELKQAALYASICFVGFIIYRKLTKTLDTGL